MGARWEGGARGEGTVTETAIIPFERIATVIHVIRGQKVMLDRDLAKLYGVPTKALKQAVRRNADRFPEDFMFVLTQGETGVLRSQTVTSKTETRGGTQYAPMAFTEQGQAGAALTTQNSITRRVVLRAAGLRIVT